MIHSDVYNRREYFSWIVAMLSRATSIILTRMRKIRQISKSLPPCVSASKIISYNFFLLNCIGLLVL